jgi:hypothetical protein
MPTQVSHKKRTFLYKINSTKIVSLFLLSLGSIALTFSIIYASSVLAFIGLGLVFWGAITLYITPEKYVKQILLDSTIIPSLTNLNLILTELGYQGKAIYLPPKYLKDFETSKVYISKDKNTSLPTPEQIQEYENRLLVRNTQGISQGILLTPPGTRLMKLFEKTLKTSFTKMNLEHLQQKLPKLFIEDLEIAEDLEIQIINSSVQSIQIKNNSISIRVTNSIYKDIHKEAEKLSHICCTIGCPICSAIACAMVKTIGKPITIERTQTSEDGKVIEAYYEIIDEN